MFEVQEAAQAMHLVVERFESWIINEELGKSEFLASSELRRIFAQDCLGATPVFNLRGDLTAEGHEVVSHDANDMEAVGNDLCVGEPMSDQGAVGVGEVNTDDLYTLSAFETLEESR